MCCSYEFPDGSPRPFVISATTDNGEASKLVITFTISLSSICVGVADVTLIFGVGDYLVCLDINTVNDNSCEIDAIEDFFSNLAYVSGEQPINIDPARAHVIINDTAEPE